MITLVRIDNRLVHGQVIEGWLPHLKIKRVLVLDGDAAQNPLARASMGLAMPRSVDLKLVSDTGAQAQGDLAEAARDAVPTLVLFRDVSGAFEAAQHGLKLSRLNLGNIHFKDGRHPITASVFLDGEELRELGALAQAGVQVEARTLPTEPSVGLAEIEARFQQVPGGPRA